MSSVIPSTPLNNSSKSEEQLKYERSEYIGNIVVWSDNIGDDGEYIYDEDGCVTHRLTVDYMVDGYTTRDNTPKKYITTIIGLKESGDGLYSKKYVSDLWTVDEDECHTFNKDTIDFEFPIVANILFRQRLRLFLSNNRSYLKRRINRNSCRDLIKLLSFDVPLSFDFAEELSRIVNNVMNSVVDEEFDECINYDFCRLSDLGNTITLKKLKEYLSDIMSRIIKGITCDGVDVKVDSDQIILEFVIGSIIDMLDSFLYYDWRMTMKGGD